jgi:hypothetical protein
MSKVNDKRLVECIPTLNYILNKYGGKIVRRTHVVVNTDVVSCTSNTVEVVLYALVGVDEKKVPRWSMLGQHGWCTDVTDVIYDALLWLKTCRWEEI